MLFFLFAFTLTVKTLAICIFIKCPTMNIAKFNVKLKMQSEPITSTPCQSLLETWRQQSY